MLQAPQVERLEQLALLVDALTKPTSSAKRARSEPMPIASSWSVVAVAALLGFRARRE